MLVMQTWRKPRMKHLIAWKDLESKTREWTESRANDLQQPDLKQKID
jgi:hypothetical protein